MNEITRGLMDGLEGASLPSGLVEGGTVSLVVGVIVSAGGGIAG